MNRRQIVVLAMLGIAVAALVAVLAFRPAPSSPPPMKVFYVSARTAENGNFNVTAITVNQGDHVVIRMRSLDTTHGVFLSTPWLTINELAPPGQETTVEFDAFQKGTYTIHCSNALCSPRHAEMTITLTIQ